MSDKTPLKDLVWQGYEPWKTEEEIRMDFEIKYGRPPETIRKTRGAWLVGPLLPAEVEAGK